MTATRTAIRAGQPSWSGRELEFVERVIQSGWLTQGVMVQQFEEEFAAWVGAAHAVATTSGTTALHLAMAAVIRPGDEVIVPAVTFVATANAARYCGARLVFADIDPVTWTLDPADVEDRITPKTQAIIPVHLYGVPADMVEIKKIALMYNLHVVEDCAEAIGAKAGREWDFRHVGTLGDAGVFSFFANKTITTGEGGMIVTNNAALAKELRHLRGQAMTERRYWHDKVGFNYRMTEMQAALGCAQMTIVDDVLARRRKVVGWYKRELEGLDFTLQRTHAGDRHGCWAVAGLLGEGIPKERLVAHMTERGIETRPVFPVIAHMPMYRRTDVFDYAEGMAWRGLVLPTHGEMTEEDVRYVVGSMREFLEVGS